jgi:hypothetical protein
MTYVLDCQRIKDITAIGRTASRLDCLDSSPASEGLSPEDRTKKKKEEGDLLHRPPC